MHHVGLGRPASRGTGLTLWVRSDRAVQSDIHWLRHPLRGNAAKDRSRRGLPSGRCSYGDYKQGAHPVAVVAKARCGGRRRGDGSALEGRCSSAPNRSRRAGGCGLRRHGQPENGA